MKRMLSIMAASALSAGVAIAADVPVTASITTDTIWTNDNEYILNGFIFVSGGASLTIEPGTVIRAVPGTGAQATALIIARDSKIYALGTPSDPIVFTVVGDPMDGSRTPELGGAWGGVVILGNAPLNSNKTGTVSDPIQEFVEGIPAAFADLAVFGGDDPDDNSGIFRYVSIRFGGSALATNSEINGLTMGGVGSGTIIEFVEVFANADDGFEWFGGTVNARFLVSAFQGDDGFDYDEGWVGKGQFWFSISNGALTDANDTFTPDNGFELDGQETSLSDLIGGGLIYNATSIGPGVSGGQALRIRDNGFVKIHNSIFTGYTGAAVRIEESSADRIDPADEATAIEISHNIWGSFRGTTPALLAHGDESAGENDDEAYLWTTAALNNTVGDPLLRGISRGTAAFEGDAGLDPRPAAASPAWTNTRKALPASDPWFIDVPFQGAFGDNNWLKGWTYLDQAGYLVEEVRGQISAPVSTSNITRVDAGPAGFSNVGFELAGDLPRQFIIRGKGKKLLDGGLAGPYIDPRLIIRRSPSGDVVATETQWLDREDPIDAISAHVNLATLGASEGRPTIDDTGAAVIITLNPGVYTFRLEDENGTGGLGQLEVYMTDL